MWWEGVLARKFIAKDFSLVQIKKKEEEEEETSELPP